MAFTYTKDSSVLDADGFLVADFGYWKDARDCCEQANEQLAAGEALETVERRLRDWAAQLELEMEADTASAIHFAD